MTDVSERMSVRTPGFGGLAGYARRDVTGPVGIRNRNWGAATSDLAVGVHRPLEVASLVIANQDRSGLLVLATWDNCAWNRVDDWKLFQSEVLAALDLAPDQFIINLSHTHSGVQACRNDVDLPGGAELPEYMDSITRAVIDASREAITALRPVTIEWTTGHSDVAVNRDLLLDGVPMVGFNPEGAADPTIMIGRVSAEDGSAVATMVNYACHGTTLGPENILLSPDYVGALREIVETGTDAPCLFLQGASGDTSPREQYSGDVGVADRHGRAIGHAVMAALETLPPPATDLTLTKTVESGAPLAYWTPEVAARASHLSTNMRLVELPLQPLRTIEQLEDDWADIPSQSRDERLRRVSNVRDGYVDLANRPDSVDHALWFARIGDALLVAHPGEAYNWFQTELRRRFPGVPVIVLGLSNGRSVYLPDVEAYERNAYQAWQTVLAHGALEKLVDAAESALASLR